MKIIFYLFPCFLFAIAAVAPDNWGGRFGDSLLHYLHAKWLSYKYHLPLLYKPFPYSSELLIDQKELCYDLSSPEQFIIRVAKGPLDPSPPLPTLYICPFFPEGPWECEQYPSGRFYIEIDWKDPHFRRLVSEVLVPIHPLKLLLPPADTINIALHVREGGGYDDSSSFTRFPIKFPPLSFYKEGLARVLELFPDRSIYCFLFTDAKNPSALAKIFSAAAPHVTFDYRKTNHHNRNVLEDFFSLFHFDILIRPQSNFSVVPSLLHDFAVLYYPKEPNVGELVIDEVSFQKLLQEK